MEFVLLSAILVGAIATVDINERNDRSDDDQLDQNNANDRPYGVHG